MPKRRRWIFSTRTGSTSSTDIAVCIGIDNFADKSIDSCKGKFDMVASCCNQTCKCMGTKLKNIALALSRRSFESMGSIGRDNYCRSCTSCSKAC